MQEDSAARGQTIRQLQAELQVLKQRQLTYSSQQHVLQELEENLLQVRAEKAKAAEFGKREVCLQKSNILHLAN
jgi:hypothetical protein